MKKKILIALGIVLVVIIIAVIAGGGSDLVTSAHQLDSAVSNGMSLQDVRDAMSPELQNEAMRLPALDIEEQSEGSWHFVPKDNADLGDTDAPYIVMAVPEDNDFLMLFFRNDELFDKAWFDYEGGWNIIDQLWTAQT